MHLALVVRHPRRIGDRIEDHRIADLQQIARRRLTEYQHGNSFAMRFDRPRQFALEGWLLFLNLGLWRNGRNVCSCVRHQTLATSSSQVNPSNFTLNWPSRVLMVERSARQALRKTYTVPLASSAVMVASVTASMSSTLVPGIVDTSPEM